MQSNDNEITTEKLTQALIKLQDLYHQKKEQLEVLHQEINELHSIIKKLTDVISNQSFTSADLLYSKSSAKEEKTSEDYFNETISEEEFKGTQIKRKIFSKDEDSEEHLLCVLKFNDFKTLDIKFIEPEERKITETSDEFINLFLKKALVKIKDSNPDLNIKYDFLENTNIIKSIHVSNLTKMNDYDLITKQIEEILRKKIG
ncbi:MAG: hypothetical protein EU533_09055 [Promethearchaeota archaeon]|nr:MAG: hypothetical protein EU533_09055 [Candidatus Lokiarchaeota archaeon]